MRIKASQKGDAAAAIEKAKISALIVRVAAGEALHVDQEPRLIVFGFDKDQKDGPIWQRHRQRLVEEFGLIVYAIGNPATGGAAAFTRRAGQ